MRTCTFRWINVNVNTILYRVAVQVSWRIWRSEVEIVSWYVGGRVRSTRDYFSNILCIFGELEVA